MRSRDGSADGEGTPRPPIRSGDSRSEMGRGDGPDADPPVGGEACSDSVSARLDELRDPGRERYERGDEVGRGGFGAVLRVFDTDLRRDLAMKVLLGRGESDAQSAHDAPPELLARFLEEAQVTGQLDHPGVVPVHELGIDAEGRVYFTMQLVRGEELSKIIARVHAGDPDWSLTRALGVLLKVCEAMAYAHEKGVIHRDLKPDNVMVGRHGEVYVMDWGVAKIVGRPSERDLRIRVPESALSAVLTSSRQEERASGSDSPLLTMDGDVVGTPAYMSPEQAEGRLEELGPRTDVYAVGAILYHLLAGHMPYVKPGQRANNYAVWRWVCDGAPQPLSEVAPHAPMELVSICEKAMARSPSDRFADMEVLAGDLRAFLEGRVVRAYETGAWAEAKKWVARNRALASSLAAALVLLVAGFVTTTVFHLDAVRARERSERQRVRAEGQRYAADIALADSAVREMNLGRARALLDGLSEDGILPSVAPFEWRYLTREARGRHHRVLEGATGSIWSLASSPTERAVAFRGMAGAPRVTDFDGDERMSIPAEGVDWQLSFSRSGSELVLYSVSDALLRRIDADTGEELGALDDIVGPPSPDGNLVVRRRPGEAEVRIFDLTRDEVVGTLRVDAPYVQVVEPGGWALVAEAASRWGLRGARLVALDGKGEAISLPPAIGATAAFSRELGRIAVGDDANVVHVLDLSSGDVIRTHDLRQEQTSLVNALAISPDGSRIAASTWESVLFLIDLESGEERRLGPLESEAYDLAFTHDGRYVVSGDKDGRIRFWDVAGGEGSTPEMHVTLARPHGPVPVARDGTVFAVSSRDGAAERIRVVDSESFEDRAILEAAEVPLAFRDDGRVLVSMDRSGISHWDLSTRERLARVDLARSGEIGGEIAEDADLEWAVVSSDGRLVVVSDGRAAVRAFDLDRGEVAFSLTGIRLHSRVTAISEDGTRLAVEGSGGEIDVYDLATLERSTTLERHRQSLHSMAFCRDGRALLAGSHGDLLLWNLETGQPTELAGHRDNTVRAVAVSSDGRTAASVGNTHLKLWSLESLRELVSVPREHHGIVLGLVFDPAGTRLFVHERDDDGVSSVRVLDAPFVTDRGRGTEAGVRAGDRRGSR